jgi:D-proline reductase (dithiol) PrdB
MPELTASVSVPRLAAVEYPLGRTIGQPGDIDGQTAVLRAVLQALQDIQTPGGMVHLPFEWPESPKDVRNNPPEDPPISKHIVKHLWDLPRLLRRDVPK